MLIVRMKNEQMVVSGAVGDDELLFSLNKIRLVVGMKAIEEKRG